MLLIKRLEFSCFEDFFVWSFKIKVEYGFHVQEFHLWDPGFFKPILWTNLGNSKVKIVFSRYFSSSLPKIYIQCDLESYLKRNPPLQKLKKTWLRNPLQSPCEQTFSHLKLLMRINQGSGPDPQDPEVLGPPGFGSVSQRYGSGSFHHQAKIVRKTAISTVLLLL